MGGNSEAIIPCVVRADKARGVGVAIVAVNGLGKSVEQVEFDMISLLGKFETIDFNANRRAIDVCGIRVTIYQEGWRTRYRSIGFSHTAPVVKPVYLMGIKKAA